MNINNLKVIPFSNWLTGSDKNGLPTGPGTIVGVELGGRSP